jgi:hypothetical protein
LASEPTSIVVGWLWPPTPLKLLTKKIHSPVHLFIKTRAFSVVRTSGIAAFPATTDLPTDLALSGGCAAVLIENEFEVAADGAHAHGGHVHGFILTVFSQSYGGRTSLRPPNQRGSTRSDHQVGSRFAPSRTHRRGNPSHRRLFDRSPTEDYRGLLDDLAYFVKIARHISSVTLRGNMANSTKVLIHSQGNSEGPLREAIDYYRPNMVFLISNHGASKAPLIYKHLEDRNQAKLGRSVRDVEHVEMIFIDNAFCKDTVLQMFSAIERAKMKATARANGNKLEFYAGVAGGTKLMVIGSALAAINDGITTYYVNEETVDRSEELLFEIDFMNELMSTISWLREGHYSTKNNLRYLNEVIRREANDEIRTAYEISLSLSPITDRAVRNGMRVLEERKLIAIEKGKTHSYNSTLLGRYVLRMFYDSSIEEE